MVASTNTFQIAMVSLLAEAVKAVKPASHTWSEFRQDLRAGKMMLYMRTSNLINDWRTLMIYMSNNPSA